MVKAGIVIVSYKEGGRVLNECLKSIELQKGNFLHKIFLISNKQKNLGFTKAANIGIKKALKWGAGVVFIANPDIVLENDALTKIMPYFGKGYGILGGTMLMDGKMYVGGKINQRMFGSLCQIKEKPSRAIMEVDFVSGSLMGVRRDVFNQIGFLNEDYFLYYDDPEFCFRAKKAGFKVGIVTEAAYNHREISSDSFSKNYYLTRNRLYFLFKYGSILAKIKEIIRLPKTTWEIMKKEKSVRSYELSGIRDFLLGKKDKLIERKLVHENLRS